MCQNAYINYIQTLFPCKLYQSLSLSLLLYLFLFLLLFSLVHGFRFEFSNSRTEKPKEREKEMVFKTCNSIRFATIFGLQNLSHGSCFLWMWCCTMLWIEALSSESIHIKFYFLISYHWLLLFSPPFLLKRSLVLEN